MKIGEYEQMMSYLTRPEPTTPIEPRENLKYGSVPGEGNSKISYDPEIDTYRKKVQETVDGKKTSKYIFSQPGDSLEDFKKIKPVRSTGADDATVKARQYVDNWTKNWFDNNLKNYGVKDFDAMIDGLSSDWQLELESGDVPKASGKFKLLTPELNLPNITSGRDVRMKKGNIKPFNYNNVEFYANLESSPKEKSKTLSQYKKVFYKNKIESNPKLREGLNKFFDFMSADKRGLYLKLDGRTIKDFMNTEVSDEVKFLLDTEISGLDKTSKNEVFNSYPDLADNYNKFTEDKVRLKAVQRETEAVAKAGEKTADQYKKVKADIAKQNDVLAKMSVKEITSNKELLNSVRMSINSKTGDVSYTNYTANDPKGKPALTDLELAEKIKQKAKDKNFYVTEHIGKKSLNKTNLAFPNNIQSANYMSNSQLENARRFLINPENRNTPAAQNLDKTLEDLKLTIRGPEYGGKPIGNKIPIVFDSKTGISNIVEDQLLNNKKSNAPTFSSNPMADPSMLKKYGKYALQVAGTPLGAGVLTAGFGVDPTSAIDRSALAAEAAFAPALVKGAKQVATTPGMQKILNLGLSPKMAMRAARIASPIGIATLAGEGIYQGGKYMLERKELLESLTDEQRDNLLSRERSEAIQQNRRGDPEAFSGIMAANGGLISRQGFADGPKDPKMNRRTFMKVMGGLASIPLLGKFMKPAAKVVESAAPVIQRSVEGVPEFLMDLIAKVKLKAKTKGYEYFTGNKPEEFKDVYQVDNYVVTEKGNKTIIREIDQDGDMLYKENQMELDYDPETGGYTYNEASARPDAEGKLKDVEEYIEDDDLENMRKYTYDE